MAWVKTYPLFFRLDFWHSAASMFLRRTERKKGNSGCLAHFPHFLGGLCVL